MTRFSLVVDDACGLDEVSCVIQDTVGPYEEIVTQRAGPYLRFSHRDYNKGTSLSFVASRFGIPSSHVAIFGDGHNDLDAMRHLPEAFRCCPSNAAQEVKDMVARGHGYISPEPRTRGVLDGLAHGVFGHEHQYLGQRFDIHGGGMDLMFPHHECEIAQSTAALGHDSAKYWIHNNMITINGQKMGKSLGNFITLEELFTGNHKLLTQAYSPMTIRFFVLQAHYRSTLDFSNEALQAAEKGLDRLMKAVEALDKIKPSEQSTVDPAELETRCREALDDDLNSPMAISALFDWVRIINQLVEGQQRITAADLEKLREIVRRYVFVILGLRDEKAASAGGKDLVTPLVNMLLDLRQAAKTEKNWALSDKIRDELTAIGIRVKDRKDGCDWEIE